MAGVDFTFVRNVTGLMVEAGWISADESDLVQRHALEVDGDPDFDSNDPDCYPPDVRAVWERIWEGARIGLDRTTH